MLDKEIVNDDLWVGQPEGSRMMFVYDKKMEHQDPSKIYLFSSYSGLMAGYSRDFARDKLKTVHSLQRERAVELYSTWHRINGARFIEEENQRMRIEMEKRALEIEEAKKIEITKHKEFIRNLGLEYKGVQRLELKHRRLTHCYSCKSHLDSEFRIQCMSCEWMICSCGACGCGFEK